MLSLTAVARRSLGLQSAARALYTSGAAPETPQGGGEGDSASNSRVGTPGNNSYRPRSQDVNRTRQRGAGGDQQQAAGAGQQRREWQDRGGGGEQRGGQRRQWQERTPETSRNYAGNDPGQRRQWRERTPQAGPTGNYAGSDALKPRSPHYARVAPKPGQRQGALYPAYIYNVSQSLLREDIAAFFDGHALPEDEIRPEFSWKHFEVERFWLNFPSALDRERALSRHMAYLGCRRVLMRRALPGDFTAGIFNPLAMSSRGRYVLLDGLAQTSTSEDVLRFFQGYDLHAKSVTFLRDQEAANSRHRERERRGRDRAAEKAVVRFASLLEAHRAVRSLQGGYIGNAPIRLRVLQ